MTCSPPLSLFLLCTLVTVAALLSHLPFLRRLNRDMWRFVLESMGKKQHLELNVRVLDGWTAWLGFTWGLSLLPVCCGLAADAFLPDEEVTFASTPLMAFLSLFLILLCSILCTLWALLRRVILRHQSASLSGLPPVP